LGIVVTEMAGMHWLQRDDTRMLTRERPAVLSKVFVYLGTKFFFGDKYLFSNIPFPERHNMRKPRALSSGVASNRADFLIRDRT